MKKYRLIDLWLDDRWAPPAGRDWVWCTTVREAMTLLSTEVVENASLDHDMGTAEDGTYLLEWMAKTRNWPLFRPVIHSQNVVKNAWMKAFVAEKGPYTPNGELIEPDHDPDPVSHLINNRLPHIGAHQSCSEPDRCRCWCACCVEEWRQVQRPINNTEES